MTKADFIMRFVHDEITEIDKYIYFLKKQEHCMNSGKSSFLNKFLVLYYERRKHKLGNKLGFYIGPNCFGEGLTIYHHGSIIVNPGAEIGKNCKLHGNNCIGNNGKDNKCPVIGNNVDIGFGAVVIGDVYIADNVTIGANAVVNKSCYKENAVLVGVPAHMV